MACLEIAEAVLLFQSNTYNTGEDNESGLWSSVVSSVGWGVSQFFFRGAKTPKETDRSHFRV